MKKSVFGACSCTGWAEGPKDWLSGQQFNWSKGEEGPSQGFDVVFQNTAGSSTPGEPVVLAAWRFGEHISPWRGFT